MGVVKMTYEEMVERRYQLTIELARIEKDLLKYNNATLFVDNRKKRKPRTTTTPLTSLDPEWWPTPELLQSANENVQGIQIGIETEKFKNYYISRGKKMKNWSAAWKNWLLQASQYAEARA